MIRDRFNPDAPVKPTGRVVLDAVPAGAIVREPRNAATRLIWSADIGQAADYSAISLIERVMQPTGKFVDTGERTIVQQHDRSQSIAPIIEPELRPRLNVTVLERFELGTDYTLMARTVATWIDATKEGPHKPVLVIDHTGVGRGVFDIFRSLGMGIPIIGVTITAGREESQDQDRPWQWSVPKKDLVSGLQIVVQNRRFFVAPALPHAKVLSAEMQNFRIKITESANLTYDAWRSGDHDDLVLSVALGVWMANKMEKKGGLI